jgi:hypothetical protein
MILEPCVAGVDSTVVAVALPAIGRNLHVGIQGLQWTVTSDTLPPAAVTKNVAVRAEAVSNTVSRRVTLEDALDELRATRSARVRAVPRPPTAGVSGAGLFHRHYPPGRGSAGAWREPRRSARRGTH